MLISAHELDYLMAHVGEQRVGRKQWSKFSRTICNKTIKGVERNKQKSIKSIVTSLTWRNWNLLTPFKVLDSFV